MALKYSASSAKRLIECPGSFQLSASVPKPKDSKYGSEGTEAHSIAESFISGKAPNCLNVEMVEGAKEYSRVITNDMLDCDVIHTQLMLEHKLRLFFNNTICDAWFIGDSTLYVYDYKYGEGIRVDADMNPQLMWYALAIIQFIINRTEYSGILVDRVVLTIVQPRMDNVSRCELNPDVLAAFYKSVEKAIQLAESDNPPFAPGEHCRFCPALAICETARNKVYEDFADMPNPEALTGQQIASFIEKGEFINYWLRAVKEYAQNAISMGVEVPGWGIEQGMSNRKWTSEEQAAKMFDFLGDKIYKKSLQTPATIEKLLGKEKKDMVKDLTFREATGPRLVKSVNPVSVTEFVPFTQDLAGEI